MLSLSGKRLLGASALFAGLLFIFTWSRSWGFNFDGVCFAQHAESGRARLLFHPNHLLYTASAKLYWRLTGLFSGPRRALPALQSLDALAGAALGALLFGALSGLFPLPASFAVSAAFCLAYGFWWNAADAQAYVPAALAGLGPLFVLLSRGKVGAAWAGLAAALFALFHQLGALSALPLAWHFGRRGGPRSAAVFLACFAAPVLAAYGAVLLAWPAGGAGAALRWFMGNSVPLAASDPLWQNLAHDASGWLEKLRALYVELGVWLLGPASGGAAALDGLGVLVLLGWLAWRLRALEGDRRELACELGLWTAAYLVFLSLPHGLNPGYLVFAMMPLPALVLLALEAEPASSRRPAAVLLSALGLAAALSGLSAALDWRRPEKNEDLLRSLALAQAAGSRDYFLFGGASDFPMGRAYVPYFTRVRGTSLTGYFWRTGAGGLAGLRPELDAVLRSGGSVYLSPGLLDPSELAGIERDFHLEPGSLGAAFKKMELERVGAPAPLGSLLRLKPGSRIPEL